MAWFSGILVSLCSLGFLGFALVSLREQEPRAVRISVLLAGSSALLGFGLAAGIGPPVALVAMGAMAAVATILFLLPVGRVSAARELSAERFDERDILFARARLVPGGPEYQSYYRLRPQSRESDDAIRANPGLLSPRATLADPVLFAAPKASFAVTEALCGMVDGPVSSPVLSLEPQRLTRFVKDLGRYFGALDVGVAELQPGHVYSHVGRGSGSYGAPIPIEHTHAIAFTVEMDGAMLDAGPAAPAVMESARQYVESARVAVQLAAAIRNLGFPARAHIDGNYRVIAPLVARDAGLGEIGRIGLVMTRRLGPRVRLGVVTTSAPLIRDPATRSASTIDFCNVCRKCAECCPAKAIPAGDGEDRGGGWRWRLDAEACYRYWTVVGTDCGRCVAVCPYSHPDNLAHNLVRWGIERSGLFRRAASGMDDVFYGRKPKPKPPPRWTRVAIGRDAPTGG